MQSFECNTYFNKESAKVNNGLDCHSLENDDNDTDYQNTPGAFSSPVTAVDINFGLPIVPITAPKKAASAEQLVRRLLHPPPHAFLHGVLSLQWAIGAGGGLGQFVFRDSDERYVLGNHSVLRTRGIELGLPLLYLEWLCGDDENISAIEQGIYLTPDFFEEGEEVGLKG